MQYVRKSHARPSLRQEAAKQIQEHRTGMKGVMVFCIAMVLVCGGAYLYSINKVAVKGYAIRSTERQLSELKQENNKLRIQEADLRSLYRIEETGKRLNMFESQDVRYIEETGPIAFR